MLSHPAFVTSDVRGDTQSETLFPEKGVPSVSRTVTPDFPALWKMHDVLFIVARPRHIRLAVSQRSTHAVHARHYPLQTLIDLVENGLPDAGHDAHADHDVGRVSKLNTDLRHGRSDRPHAERQNIHRTPVHAAAEDLLQLAPHYERILPIIGRAGVVLGKRADERLFFDAGDIARISPCIETSRPQIRI